MLCTAALAAERIQSSGTKDRRQLHDGSRAAAGEEDPGRIDVYFIGDSITRRWGASDPQYSALLANWKQNFHGWNAADFGWGADRDPEHAVAPDQGELTDVNPLRSSSSWLAPTTWVADRSPGREAEVAADIAQGIGTLVERARMLAPRATIVLMGITLRNDNMAYVPVIRQVNCGSGKTGGWQGVRFLDLNDKLADASGKLYPGMTDPDQLHLAVPGYQLWADALKPVLTSLLGPPAATDSAPAPTGDPSGNAPPRK